MSASASKAYDKDKIKAEMERLDDDEFEDAVQEDADEGVTGNFKVTAEELAIIRAELANEFPEDCTYLSDAYIISVANKPYSKDPTIRRPLEYSLEKLQHVMQWRAEAGAPTMEELVKIASETTSSNDPKFPKAVAMAKSLNNASLYWHGYTKDGRPILWIRCNRKPWYPDVDAEVNTLILMADTGIKCMPDGVTDFCVISESSYPPPPNPTFMINTLKALVRGYPDRLNVLYSAPTSSIVQFVMNLLLPLMPGRLASKVQLIGSDRIKDEIVPQLLHGEADLPDFFGGPVSHDGLYPEDGKSTVKGDGMLKFDYYGMVERLKKSQEEYVNSKK